MERVGPVWKSAASEAHRHGRLELPGRGIASWRTWSLDEPIPDGYVDHMAFGPGPTLFRHFIEQARDQVGSVYGRRLYEIMRYWDEDHPEWDAARRDFAVAWRRQPKWIVSRSLTSVGPNATLVGGGIAATIRGLKDRLDGRFQVGGPDSG